MEGGFDVDKDRLNKGFKIIGSQPKKKEHHNTSGVLNLNAMSPVIVDVEQKKAYVDIGAMHARSDVEKRVKFTPNREDAAGGKLYWLVWVQVERTEDDRPFYYGVTACEMVINHEKRRGYKSLPEHVNNMDKALKGRIIVNQMDDVSKQILREFLQTFKAGLWENSSDELKEALA